MKVLMIRLDDSTDVSTMTKGKDASVTIESHTVAGVILTAMDLLDFNIEGDYHITPIASVDPTV